MRLASVIGVVCCVACGRIGFSPVSGDGASPVDAAPPWRVIQVVEGGPALSFTATAAGSTVIVGIHLATGPRVTSIVDNAPGGGNTYTAIPSADAINTDNSNQVDLWYGAVTKPGATQLTVTPAGNVSGIVVWEVSGVRATAPLDSSTSLSNQPATTLPAGPLISTSARGDFVVSVLIHAANITGIHAGNEFSNDSLSGANGWAHLTDAGAPAGSYQGQWDADVSASYCASAASFFVGP